MEEKGTEITSCLLFIEAKLVHDFIKDCIFHVKTFVLLRKVPNLDAGTNLQAPGFRLKFFDKQTKQRRLSRTIGTDQRDAIAVSDKKRYV